MRLPSWKIMGSTPSKNPRGAAPAGGELEKEPETQYEEDEQTVLPIRLGPDAPSDESSLQLHAVPDNGSLLVKIQTPQAPDTAVEHVPCDIILVIDVSGSMSAAAPAPGESEDTGLSILDLVKHAANTIVETLNPRDRLGIVTFGSRSEIIQPLASMTSENKDEARKKINGMQATDATNLWHGILDGLKVLKDKPSGGSSASAIMVLTDGLPNYMCPPAGYVPKLRNMMPFPATIHTFGFGYNLRSGLLKSIAEIGSGNYAFIPDAGMIGTVFVHAVANLQSTYATNATLSLTYQSPLELEETMDSSSVIQQPPEKTVNKEGPLNKLTIHLGNLQYGQSRDIVLRVRNADGAISDEKQGTIVSAVLTAERLSLEPSLAPARLSLFAAEDVLSATTLPAEQLDYHESRAQLCKFLSSLFPTLPDGEHKVTKDEKDVLEKLLDDLISNIPARNHADPLNASLMEDLVGEEPKGQISIAIKNREHFNKWGIHYLPSYLNAHTRQICNSFKDPGPLQYGKSSQLFISCRDKLDTAFDSLPAPVPTAPRYTWRANGMSSSSTSPRSSRPIKMSLYNTRSGPCFAASTPVELASGSNVAIRQLRKGMRVQTPAGPRRVHLVLRTPVREEPLCRVGGLLVTPWHPISFDSREWHFPAEVADGPVRYTGSVYSVLLQADGDSAAHALRVAGVWGVALGHGIVSGSEDVRAHEFLGSRARVEKALGGLGIGRGGVVVGGGVKRDERTGCVSGFKKAAGMK